MAVRELLSGAAVTMVIGGSAYTFSQADVVDNFATDTGMSQQEAEQYVSGVEESDLVSYEVLGEDYMQDGEDLLELSSSIDCVTYEYEWETPTLPCVEGKSQLYETGLDEKSLGQAYKRLGTDSGSQSDIRTTISLLDEVNDDYEFEIVRAMLKPSIIEENVKTNSYNKAVLQAALESE